MFRGGAPVLTRSGVRNLRDLDTAKTDAQRAGRSPSVEEQIRLNELHTASAFTRRPGEAEPMKSASHGNRRLKPVGRTRRKRLHRVH